MGTCRQSSGQKIMNTRAEFSVPIYCVEVDDIDRVAIKSEIENLDAEFYSGEDYGLESNALLTDISKNLLSSQSLEKLNKVFLKHLNNYLKDVSDVKRTIEINSSWLTKTKKGQNIEPHCHYDKDISCVYYIKTNTKDGDLILYTPNPAVVLTKFIDGGNLSIQPKEGRIVFFPSWILHSTTRNKTDHERTSLAVDITVN